MGSTEFYPDSKFDDGTFNCNFIEIKELASLTLDEPTLCDYVD